MKSNQNHGGREDKEESRNSKTISTMTTASQSPMESSSLKARRRYHDNTPDDRPVARKQDVSEKRATNRARNRLQRRQDHHHETNRRRAEENTSVDHNAVDSNDDVTDDDDDDDTVPGAQAIPAMGMAQENPYDSHDGDDSDDLDEEYTYFTNNNDNDTYYTNNNDSQNNPTDPIIVANTVDDCALAAEYNVPSRDEIRERILRVEVTTASDVRVLEEKSDKLSLWKQVMALLVLLMTVVVVVVVVVLVVVLPSNKTQQESGMSETNDDLYVDEHWIYLQNLLGPISGIDVITDNATHQYQALTWLFKSYDNDDDNIGNNDTMTNDLAEQNDNQVVERYILALLYFSMGGDNWIRNKHFLLTNVSVCEWQFINCHPTGSVYSIQFDNNNLTGSIPHELGYIQTLERLNLPENQITGTIPDSIGKLSRLSFLQLAINELTGTIPASFANLTQLEILVLFRNHLTGIIPSGVTSLPQLKVLYLGDNMLTGTLPSFVDLPTSQPPQNTKRELEEIYMDGNYLTGPIPTSLYSLSNLSLLSLSQNELTGTIHDVGIGQLTRLEFLSIFVNQLSGSIPTRIGQLEFLEEFQALLNSFTGTIPTEFGRLKSLRKVLLSANQLTGPLPSEFGQLPLLHTLDVETNFLTGTVPSSLQFATSLERLSVSVTSMTGTMESLFCNPDRARSIFEIEADCGGDEPEIKCSCCTRCCQDEEPYCPRDVNQLCQNIGSAIRSWVAESPAVCNCEVGSNEMTCNFQTDCVTCNEDGTVCGISKDYGYVLRLFGTLWDSWKGSFEYQTGRTETVSLEYVFSTKTCAVSIDGQQCANCDTPQCGDGYDALFIDCSNVQTGNATDSLSMSQRGPIYHSCDDIEGQEIGPLEVFRWMDTGLFTGCPPMMVTNSYFPMDYSKQRRQ